MVEIYTQTEAVSVKLPIYISVSKGQCKVTGASIEVERRVDELPMYQDREVLDVIGSLTSNMDVPEIVDLFAKIEGMRSIKIIDKNGLGAIVLFEH